MGPDHPSIVIVGEAPGYQEARTGIPFTGPSGKLLDLVLAHNGIDRSEAYIDNICACRPANNDTPSKKAIQCCWPRIKSEIQKREPDTILCLGNTAAQTILDTRTGITQLRVGTAKKSSIFPTANIIATFHPAACLRQSDLFPHMVNDIGKVNYVNKLNWQPPVFRVFNDPQEAVLALREIRTKYQELVLDIEVGIEKDTDFGHPENYDFLCLGFGYAKGKVAVIGEDACDDERVREEIALLFKDQTKKWICHNGKFDLAGVSIFGRAKLFFDTMVANYVLDERAGIHGLKYIAVELLGAPKYDDEIKRYVGKGDSYAVVPKDILYKYNAYDVACTWDLYEHHSKELDRVGQRSVHDFLCEASNMLMGVEMAGIQIDEAYLDELTESYLEVLDQLVDNLKPWVKNPRSPKQVKEAFEEMGKNVDSTNIETLEFLLATSDSESELYKFVQLMIKHRREQKLYGTYVKGIRKRLYRGRVHPTFLIHGTTSGRLSCRNPNLQNIPRESSIRRQFIPGRGNIFVQADYAQAELRVIAYLAKDDYLRSVFNEGRDIHGEVAERFYGPGWTKEQRVRAKAVVFGLAYGREAKSIADEFDIPYAEASRFVNAFFEVIPQTVAWRESIKEKVLHAQEDLITPFGRRRRFWLITKDNTMDTLKEAYSFLPQSTASDICLSAAIEMDKRGIPLRNLVHDSILAEVPEEEGEDVAGLMEEIMEEVALIKMGDFVKFKAESKIGCNWGEV